MIIFSSLLIGLTIGQILPIIEYEMDNIDGTSLPNTGSGAETYDLDLSVQISNNYASVNTFGEQGTCQEMCFSGTAPTDSCIMIPYDTDVADVTNLSFELMLKQTSYSNHLEWIMSQDDGGYDRSILMKDSRFGAGDKLSLGVGGTYTSTVDLLELNEYTHLVAVWEGGAGGTASVYLNGELAQSMIIIQRESSSRYGYFCLEQNAAHSNHQWNGCMHQVRVYDEAVDATQVANLYDTATKKQDSCDTPPPPKRDCSAFNIDGFLVDCSEEFELNEEEFDAVQKDIGVIEGRLDDVDNKIKSLENADKDLGVKADEIDTRLGGRLNGIDGDIVQLRDEDKTLDTKLNDADKRLSDRIGDNEVAHNELKDRVSRIESTLNAFSSAQSVFGRNDLNEVDDGTSPSGLSSMSDLLIVGLIVCNIGTILTCISCLFWSKRNGVKGHIYDGVVNYDEEQKLQK